MTDPVAHLKKYLTVFAAAGLTAFTAPAAQAEQNPVLVELFTSQGCSSCPPADALLEELDKDEGVVALAYHVQYWDYLGWKDALGQPAFDQRQHGYANAHHKKMVYTPQIVIAGQTEVVGSDEAAVRAAIESARQAQIALGMRASRVGESVELRLSKADLSETFRITLVHVGAQTQVAIEHGENAGRVIHYVNPVQALHHVGDWTGAEMFMRIPLSRDQRAAVIVQDGEFGPVLASAWVE